VLDVLKLKNRREFHFTVLADSVERGGTITHKNEYHFLDLLSNFSPALPFTESLLYSISTKKGRNRRNIPLYW
jgi:hypothetical protein